MIYDITYHYDIKNKLNNDNKRSIDDNIEELVKINNLDVIEFNKKINLLFDIIKELKNINLEYKNKCNYNIKKANKSIEKCKKIVNYINNIDLEKLI